MGKREAEALRLRAEIFKALGHPTRLWIVEHLANGECCVADLAAGVEGGLSAVSQHLALLRETGIVRDIRRGRQIYYSLTFPCIVDMCAMLGGLRDFKSPTPIERLQRLLPLLLLTLSATLLFGIGLAVGSHQMTSASKLNTLAARPHQTPIVHRPARITDDFRYCLRPCNCPNNCTLHANNTSPTP